MRTSHVPVLVVGAGPTGSMVALELARRGVHVRTIDRLAHAASSSRAFTIDGYTLEMLERIDKRLVDRFLDRGVRIDGYRVHVVDAAGRRSDVRPAVDLAARDSRYAFSLGHRQSETEQYLREYTSAHFGVAPDWGTACVELDQDSQGVTATIESEGVREHVRCRYLVACDGAESGVRRLLGLPSRNDGGVLVDNLDAFVDGLPDDTYVHVCTGPDHGLIAARLPGDWVRVLLARRGADAQRGVATGADIVAVLARHFDGVALGEELWRAQWRVPPSGVPKYRAGRVLLAGDAAHARFAAVGVGLNRGLWDAHNLGWKLAFVVKGVARPALLDTYEAERAASAAGHEGATLDEILVAPHAVLAERLEQLADPRARGAAIRAGAPDARGDAAALPGPAVGERAPDVDLGRGHALFDLMRHPLCTLLGLAAEESGVAALEAALRPLATRFAAVASLRVLGPSAALAARYGASDANRVFLVRPDGYVGARVPGPELPDLEAALVAWFAS